MIGRPMFRRTVLGNDPKHFHHAVILEMDNRAGCRNIALTHRPIACPVRVDPPVLLEPCQPKPSKPVDLPEIHQTAVPTIEKHIFRLKTPFLGRIDQVPKMVVL